MKKTITTALLCLGLATAASANSTRVDFDDASVDTTYAPYQATTLTASDDVSLSSTNANNKWFDSTTTFTLDLAALNALDLTDGSTVALVTLTSGDVSVGLGVKNVDGTNKLTMMWQGSAYGSSTYALDGSGVYSLITECGGATQPCTYLFDSGKDTPAGLYQSAGLGVGNKNTLDSVTVASQYVDYFAVSDVALNVTAAGIGEAAKAIPEPATATLSLLALAGLAARRRRK